MHTPVSLLLSPSFVAIQAAGEFHLKVTEWSPSPWIYTAIWTAWLAAILAIARAISSGRKPGWRVKSGAIALAVTAVTLLSVTAAELRFISQNVTWPAFSWPLFALYGSPVCCLAIIGSVVRRHSLSKNVG
jgi:uncharacterized membrane protein